MQLFTHKDEDSHYITDGIGFALEITEPVVNGLLVPCFEKYASSMLTWREMKTERDKKLHVNRMIQDEWTNGRLPTLHERCEVLWAIRALDGWEHHGKTFDWQNMTWNRALEVAKHPAVRARIREIRMKGLVELLDD